MTARTFQWLADYFQQRDPQDWVNDLLDSVASLTGTVQLFIEPVTFATATFTLGTTPTFTVLNDLFIARTTVWDAITTFQVGKAGTTDWLCTTAQANADGAIPAGESQDVEHIALNVGVDAATPIVVTLNHGAATQGSGYVILVYTQEVQIT